MKKIIALTFIFLGSLTSFGQTTTEDDVTDKYTPQQGDFSFAVLFGRGNFFSSNLVAPPSPAGEWTIPGNAPYADFVSANDNSASNMVGVEGRYFLTEKIALKLSGGAILRDTPSRINIESGTDFSEEDNQVWIPNYASVNSDEQVDININLGGEYHFDSRFDRISPYAGLTIPFYYARRSMYDPSITTSPNGEPVIADIGNRHLEVVGTGAQLVAGLDFHLLEGFYIGAETKPVSYIYSYSQKSPGPGLEHLEADSHTFSFLAQNFLKLGFKF
ncbi:BT1926 family outer membrane beta-barrel protein [Salinimicrobium gaetbulicola]|uniref:BT1926 family outer membrane beta-barrel protein n=1 Tax=Salinimicrobium gaetbulicola TaxID=999702 RepID=A0ABW3IED5_9FLAO